MSDPTEQPRRRRRQTTQPPAPQGSPARGVLLVLIAVFVGFLFLRDDATSADISVGADRTTTPSGDEDPDSTTTSTTTPPRSPSQVKVLVANGSGVNGAAGRQTNDLETLGYVTGTPVDAPDRVESSIVYYRPTYQAEGEALAETLGLDVAAVAELPTVPPIEDLQLANILLIIGPDLATAA